MRKRSANIARFLVFLLLAGGAAYFFLFTSAGEMFRTSEGRKALVGGLDRAVQAAGPLGPLLFILVYAVGSTFAPVTPFTIAGAVIFGKFYGMFYNLVADLAGATLAFYLGRYFLHGIARGILETRLPWLDRKAEEEGFSVIFYLRLFWFPFIVLNYAAGATRIRFRDYFLGSLLGLLPSVLIVTYFVGALKDVLASYRRPADLVTPQIFVPILLLILSFFIPTLVKRFRKPPAA